MSWNFPKQFDSAVFLPVILILFSGGLACRQFAPVTVANSADSSSILPRNERIEIFEDVWKTINEQYYDPKFNGVDWREIRQQYLPKIEAAKTDAEFYRLLEEMLAALRDAHTTFIRPQPKAGDNFNPPGSVGITLAEAEGKTVIAAVESDSDAARAGVRPGMILRSVNDKPIAELYDKIQANFAGSSSDRAMRGVMHGALLYGGFLGASRTFGVEGFDGQTFNFSVTHFGARPADVPTLAARRLPWGIGYLKFDAWRPPVDEQFKTELAKLTNAPGLIIDLRGNGGGQADVLLNIGSLFFPNETSFGSFKKRDGQPEQIITHRPDQIYKGKVIVLVDEISASSSEVFAAAMQESGRARIIGQQTCGCVLNSRSKQIKGGTLSWSARVYASPNNRILEGIGVMPDESVALKIIDLRQGRDAPLEAAEKFLSSR